MLKVLSDHLSLLECFFTTVLDMIVFRIRTLDAILDFICYLCSWITPLVTVSTSYGSHSIELECELGDWFLCGLDTVIEVDRSLFIHFFYSVYLFCVVITFIIFVIAVFVAVLPIIFY